MEVIKEPIRLRQRKTPAGNTTLYLDIYINGKRSYEYLKMYLVPEVTRADKEKNRETLAMAEAVRAKRIVELRNGEFGFKSDHAEETNFYDYYVAITENRLGQDTKGTWGNWCSCLKHLENYEPRLKKLTFADIDKKWVEGFKRYLEKDAYAWGCNYRKRIKDHPLSRNSRLNYYNKLKACLNKAYNDRIIAHNPIIGIDGFKPEEGTRMYLTLEEVKK